MLSYGGEGKPKNMAYLNSNFDGIDAVLMRNS